MTIKPNHKFPGWWTLYNTEGKPMVSSVSRMKVQAHYDSIVNETAKRKLLDLQCEAEEIHHHD